MQFLREDVAIPDAVIISHIHFDHLDGLGNACRLFPETTVYAADETDPHTGESVAETVARKYEYLDQLTIEARSPFTAFTAAGFDVTLVPVDHPPLLCYGVVIEDDTGTLAVTGDTSYAKSLTGPEPHSATQISSSWMPSSLLGCVGVTPTVVPTTTTLGSREPSATNI